MLDAITCTVLVLFMFSLCTVSPGHPQFKHLPQPNPIVSRAEGPELGQRIHSVDKPSYTLAVGDQVFVSSFWTNQVALIRNTKEISLFAAGNGLDGPWGLAVWNGTLLVSSFATDSIHRYNISDGSFLGRFGSELELDCPEGLAISDDGDIFVVSFLRDEVIRYSSSGTFKNVAAKDHLQGPEDVVVYRNSILVTSHYTDAINKYGFDGQFEGQWASVDKPVGITVGFDSHIYVAAYGSHSIHRYNGSTGAFIDVFASGSDLRGPSSLSFSTFRTLYVSSYENDRVVLFNSTAGVSITVVRKLIGR